LSTQAIEAPEFIEQHSPDPQHGFGDGDQAAVFPDQFEDPRLECRRVTVPIRRPKTFKEPRTEFSRSRA
jgi:hypothetical protein